MKKSTVKDQKQKRTSRRLSLQRETILVLDDPALLELARGGKVSEGATMTGPGNSDTTRTDCD
jgi:hypothetical protein